MIRVMFGDDFVIRAKDADDVIAQMMAGDFSCPRSFRRYLKTVAARCHTLTGRFVPSGSARELLMALIEVGLIKEVMYVVP